MKITTYYFILMLTYIIFTTPANAELYQWVDKNGIITFKDTPPPSNNKRLKVKRHSDNNYTHTPQQTTQYQSEKAEKTAIDNNASNTQKEISTKSSKQFSGTVEIFVTSWCGYCKQAERYMQSKGIPFVSYDIEKDASARQRHSALGGRGVPLIVVGSRTLSGFSPEALEQYLGKR